MAGLTRQVLVVEDDDDVRTVISEVLGEEGFEVVSAHDGREALELLSVGAARPAVVLLDVLMPHLDGVDLLLAARALVPGFDDVPVIVMSGMGSTDERPRMKGVTAWLEKPFEYEALLGAILATTCAPPEQVEGVLARRLLRHLGRHGELPELRAALHAEDFVTVAAVAGRLRATGQHFGMASLVRIGEAIAAAAARRQVDTVTDALRALADVVLGLQGRQ